MNAYSCFLALRYLLTRWVNVLGVFGIAVAVWALIVVIAVFSGFIAEIREHIRGATADLVVTRLPDVQGPAPASYAALRPLLEADADVVATAPRLQHHAILYPHGSNRRPIAATDALEPTPSHFNFVKLLGVDPAAEERTSEFRRWLERVDHEQFRVTDRERPFQLAREHAITGLKGSGVPVDPGRYVGGDDGIVLPARRVLAPFAMLWRPWQLVDVVSARFVRADGEERVVKIRRTLPLAGAYETQHRIFDETYAFVHLETLRAMLGHDKDVEGSVDVVSEVAIKVTDGADLLAVAARLQQSLRQQDPLCVVQTWEQQNRVFLGAVEQERALMKIVLFAVMLVAAFLIYATLHMMVAQKTKDIGVLTALGATPRGVAAVFLVCGAVLAAIGCGLGTLSGWLSAIYLNDVNDWCKAQFGVELFPTALYSLPRIPFRLEAGWIAQVVGGAFLLALLVSFLPSRRAARLDPITALNYE